MSRRRVKQHRPQRESSTRDKRDLVQENRQLKREVARLRKQLDQADEPQAEDKVEDKVEEEKATVKCPQCKGTPLASITTPSGKTIYLCRGCAWRGSI